MVWILRDDFGFNSFNKHYFEKMEEDQYMKMQFEVKGFMNDRKQSYDLNTVGRIHNGLVGAIRDKIILPKFIVLVIDNDVIRYVRHKNLEITQGSESAYERILKWLMCQYDRLIKTQKDDYLPKKAKKNPIEPMFIWIIPPTNCNFKDNPERRLFGRALEKAVAFHEHTFALELKKA